MKRTCRWCLKTYAARKSSSAPLAITSEASIFGAMCLRSCQLALFAKDSIGGAPKATEQERLRQPVKSNSGVQLPARNDPRSLSTWRNGSLDASSLSAVRNSASSDQTDIV